MPVMYEAFYDGTLEYKIHSTVYRTLWSVTYNNLLSFNNNLTG
mgnify:CR=1 FL=1